MLVYLRDGFAQTILRAFSELMLSKVGTGCYTTNSFKDQLKKIAQHCSLTVVANLFYPEHILRHVFALFVVVVVAVVV